MARANNNTPDGTVIANPVATHLEKRFTHGKSIASILDFTAEDSRDEHSTASIAVEYTDGSIEEIVLDQTLQDFLNTSYAFA